ncbi:IBR finger domain-containing protein [Colletotrichum cereale]|nr:IBR finger domain-containing protein [Colletotrichum cereale]
MEAESLDDMDDETLQLILELQQNDLRELQHGNVQPFDGHQDDQMAIELYQEELASLAAMASDRAMARRIEEEEAAEADREEPIDEAAAQHLNPAEQQYHPGRTAECVICRDVHDTRELYENHGCQHMYCADCLRDLFESSINDEALFPPRCCGHAISIDDISGQFSDEFVEIFHAKSVEYSTTDRTYCHVPTCSAFIPPATTQGDVGTCPDCQTRVCALYKGPEHQNHACIQDAAAQEVLRLAEENNWKRCPSCQTVVELGMGCHHITCRCNAHFCYLCLAKWKSCQCRVWDEARIIAAGEERVRRDPQAHNLAQEERQAAVLRAQVYIQENHECDHTAWRSVNIDRNTRHLRECEGCNERMPFFIYQCRQCEISACRRCRYNRFR